MMQRHWRFLICFNGAKTFGFRSHRVKHKKNGTAYGANRLEVIFMTEDEKKLMQAKHRLEQAENRNRKKERSERNHRLIVEGAILEKLLPEIKTMNLTEIEGYLRGKLN